MLFELLHLQEALENERQALEDVGKQQEALAVLHERLRVSEDEKGRLIEEIANLKMESIRWEEALDRLQVGCPLVA